MAVTDFLLLGAGLGAAYYLLRPQKTKETSQELLDITDVTEDGIIELPGFKFRSVIEVVPINMALRSFDEQGAIWVGFRNTQLPYRSKYIPGTDAVHEYQRLR